MPNGMVFFHNINTLCYPAATTSNARLTCSCPLTSQKSTVYAGATLGMNPLFDQYSAEAVLKVRVCLDAVS